MNYFITNIKEITKTRLVLITWALFCLCFGLGPILFGYINAGTIIIFLYSIFILFTVFLNKKTVKSLFFKFIWALLIFSTSVATIMTATMLTAAYGTQYNGTGQGNVLVLGCKVSNGKPSLMLTDRLERAYRELEKHPSLNCIVSGGHTQGEPMSEAEVMYNYLIEKGIEKNRIFVENFSTDTQENIVFSKRIIQENNLSTTVIISTNGFHQFRAAFYAKLNGLTPYAATCKTPIGLTPSYYVREYAAILKLLVLDLF